MDADFSCTIRSPAGTLFVGRARFAVLPVSDGEVEVLPGHADAFFALSPGKVLIGSVDGSRPAFEVRGGVFRIKGGSASAVV